MKKLIYILVTVLIISFSACVKNPNVTEDKFLNTPNAMTSWVTGVQRQTALMYNQVAINSEIISDNYFNNNSAGYSKAFDFLQIVYTDPDVNFTLLRVSTLLQMCEYGIRTVAKNDAATKPQDLAFLYFSKGLAQMVGAETFVGMPIEPLGQVQNSEALFQHALKSLDTARSYEKDELRINTIRMFKARIYHRLGDAERAMAVADSLIAGKDFIYSIAFDGTNNLRNEMQQATYDILPNRFAPLPRLDFLDPKYYSVGTQATDQKNFTLAKKEEAYLIKAEALLSKNNIGDAKKTLSDLLALVNTRKFVSVDDSKETRNGGIRTNYPKKPVAVRADSESAYINGLVLDRAAGNIKLYPISHTYLTDADIAAANSVDELLYLTYLLRQHIFFAEGRRLADLGIKLPISETEALKNNHVTNEHTKVFIPNFIPSSNGMDDFEIDAATGAITVKYDMNKIIVNNKASKNVAPFF